MPSRMPGGASVSRICDDLRQNAFIENIMLSVLTKTTSSSLVDAL